MAGPDQENRQVPGMLLARRVAAGLGWVPGCGVVGVSQTPAHAATDPVPHGLSTFFPCCRHRSGRIVAVPSGELCFYALGAGEYNELARALRPGVSQCPPRLLDGVPAALFICTFHGVRSAPNVLPA